MLCPIPSRRGKIPIVSIQTCLVQRERKNPRNSRPLALATANGTERKEFHKNYARGEDSRKQTSFRKLRESSPSREPAVQRSPRLAPTAGNSENLHPISCPCSAAAEAGPPGSGSTRKCDAHPDLEQLIRCRSTARAVRSIRGCRRLVMVTKEFVLLQSSVAAAASGCLRKGTLSQQPATADCGCPGGDLHGGHTGCHRRE